MAERIRGFADDWWFYFRLLLGLMDTYSNISRSRMIWTVVRRHRICIYIYIDIDIKWQYMMEKNMISQIYVIQVGNMSMYVMYWEHKQDTKTLWFRDWLPLGTVPGPRSARSFALGLRVSSGYLSGGSVQRHKNPPQKWWGWTFRPWLKMFDIYWQICSTCFVSIDTYWGYWKDVNITRAQLNIFQLSRFRQKRHLLKDGQLRSTACVFFGAMTAHFPWNVESVPAAPSPHWSCTITPWILRWKHAGFSSGFPSDFPIHFPWEFFGYALGVWPRRNDALDFHSARELSRDASRSGDTGMT